LSEQFTDLIILQRGFQSSSQVTSVANEMIQQLLEIDRPR
jgi:flagellar hook protein FlgE